MAKFMIPNIIGDLQYDINELEFFKECKQTYKFKVARERWYYDDREYQLIPKNDYVFFVDAESRDEALKAANKIRSTWIENKLKASMERFIAKYNELSVSFSNFKVFDIVVENSSFRAYFITGKDSSTGSGVKNLQEITDDVFPNIWNKHLESKDTLYIKDYISNAMLNFFTNDTFLKFDDGSRKILFSKDIEVQFNSSETLNGKVISFKDFKINFEFSCPCYSSLYGISQEKLMSLSKYKSDFKKSVNELINNSDDYITAMLFRHDIRNDINRSTIRRVNILLSNKTSASEISIADIKKVQDFLKKPTIEFRSDDSIVILLKSHATDLITINTYGLSVGDWDFGSSKKDSIIDQLSRQMARSDLNTIELLGELER